MPKILFPIKETFIDYPDNESNALIIYFMGCSHNCGGCQNPDFQNMHYNNNTINVDSNILDSIIQDGFKRYNTNKIVLSGGDPLYSKNIEYTKELVLKYDVCIYTGYEMEYVHKFISGYKFIKCGKYIEELHQLSEKTNQYIKFASTNQKLYNSKEKLLSVNGIYYF